MTPHSLLLLVIAACVHSWPQLSFSNGVLPPSSEPLYTRHDRREVRRQLPVDEDLDMSAVTLPVANKLPEKRNNARRQLPVDEGLDISSVTLPVPPRRRGPTGAGAERSKARQLPGEEIDSPGVLTLPVIHFHKAQRPETRRRGRPSQQV